MRGITITDKQGGEHNCTFQPTDDAGGFKLICVNSGEELARGEEYVKCSRPGSHRFIDLYSNDPSFEHGLLAMEIEGKVNEEAA